MSKFPKPSVFVNIQILVISIITTSGIFGEVSDDIYQSNAWNPKINTGFRIDVQQPNLTEWKKWVQPIAKSPLTLREQFVAKDKEFDRQRLLWGGKGFSLPLSSKAEDKKPADFTVRNNTSAKDKHKVRTSSKLFWSKRQIDGRTFEKLDIERQDALVTYQRADEQLRQLRPNLECIKKLALCSNMPFKYLECIANCYVSLNLAQDNTKFLFRLIYIFRTFARHICPTFGSVYDTIPTVLKKSVNDNSLQGFLTNLGFSIPLEPIHIEFIKNAPLALFTNLIKFAGGTEFELMKPIIASAQSAAEAELAEQEMFPSLYHNPLCKKAPEKGWVISLIETIQSHPVISDIFLRGLWVITRAFSINLSYPLDNLFGSWIMVLKMLAGTDCSLVSYAEQGKPFKCIQESPVDKMLDDYRREAESNKNPFSWLVCGAHQVDVPDWIKDKIQSGLSGRTKEVPTSTDKPLPTLADLSDVGNPEEYYYDMRL